MALYKLKAKSVQVFVRTYNNTCIFQYFLNVDLTLGSKISLPFLKYSSTCLKWINIIKTVANNDVRI